MSIYFEIGLIGYDGDAFFRAHRTGDVIPPADVPVAPSGENPQPPAPARYITAPSLPEPIPARAPTALPLPVLHPVPRFGATDYAQAAMALLPTGRAWPREPDGGQAKVMGALAQSLARVDGLASALLAGSLPGESTSMVPEWEATLGLPDPCLPTPTYPNRLAQIRARFTDRGGLSRARYIAFAAALGFEIELVTFAPFRAGVSRAGSPLAGDEALFTLGVVIVSTDGEISTTALMCQLRAIAPAEADFILLS